MERLHLLLGPQRRLQLLYCSVQLRFLRLDDRRLAAHALQLRHLPDKQSPSEVNSGGERAAVGGGGDGAVPACVAAPPPPDRPPAAASTA